RTRSSWRRYAGRRLPPVPPLAPAAWLWLRTSAHPTRQHFVISLGGRLAAAEWAGWSWGRIITPGRPDGFLGWRRRNHRRPFHAAKGQRARARAETQHQPTPLRRRLQPGAHHRAPLAPCQLGPPVVAGREVGHVGVVLPRDLGVCAEPGLMERGDLGWT